jgi:hypothetical protein
MYRVIAVRKLRTVRNPAQYGLPFPACLASSPVSFGVRATHRRSNQTAVGDIAIRWLLNALSISA